jgi:3-methyl-2-oxobutanoate hydroxymethyltransferase
MKLTRFDFERMKESGEPVAWITAYDYPTARFAEQAGLEMILVGDSLGMCVYGYENTIPVTMDQCLLHSEAVRRGAPDTFIVGDMPFLSYQVSVPEAVANAGRFFKEARVDAVKLEGGRRVLPQIRAIADGGMLLMGHIGLTPQSSGQMGGFKAQGRTAEAARELVDDALAIEEAGAFSLVLEGVPPEVSGLIRDRLRIPVYGIGAGPATDGQVMTSADMLGLFKMFTPKFVKVYADLGGDIDKAFRAYVADVKAKTFPGPEHSYTMLDGEWEKLRKLLK